MERDYYDYDSKKLKEMELRLKEEGGFESIKYYSPSVDRSNKSNVNSFLYAKISLDNFLFSSVQKLENQDVLTMSSQYNLNITFTFHKYEIVMCIHPKLCGVSKEEYGSDNGKTKPYYILHAIIGSLDDEVLVDEILENLENIKKHEKGIFDIMKRKMKAYRFTGIDFSTFNDLIKNCVQLEKAKDVSENPS